MTEKLEKDVKDIKEKINYGITISRVPKKTRKQLFQLADEEFCSDRGMALKHVIDFYFGLVPTGTEHIEHVVEQLKLDVEALKQVVYKKEEVKEPKINTLRKRIEEVRK